MTAVRAQVDAARAARSEARAAGTNALLAGSTGGACVVACPAVVRAAIDVDTCVVARGEPARAFAGALAVGAVLPSRARHPTRATVLGIRFGVDAAITAGAASRFADALPITAELSNRARRRAGSTVLGVPAQVDALAVTILLPLRADAGAGAAGASLTTGSAARAAVGRVAAQPYALSVTFRLAGAARASIGRRAAQRRQGERRHHDRHQTWGAVLTHSCLCTALAALVGKITGWRPSSCHSELARRSPRTGSDI